MSAQHKRKFSTSIAHAVVSLNGFAATGRAAVVEWKGDGDTGPAGVVSPLVICCMREAFFSCSARSRSLRMRGVDNRAISRHKDSSLMMSESLRRGEADEEDKDEEDDNEDGDALTAWRCRSPSAGGPSRP